MSKMGAFLAPNGSLFWSKSGLWPKSRNLEQTLALRIQTKGSDPSKMVLFMQLGVEKATNNGEGNKVGRRRTNLIWGGVWGGVSGNRGLVWLGKSPYHPKTTTSLFKMVRSLLIARQSMCFGPVGGHIHVIDCAK